MTGMRDNTTAAGSSASGGLNSVQVLVKLDNVKTYCLNFVTNKLPTNEEEENGSNPILYSSILNKLSHVTGIPVPLLKLRNHHKENESINSNLLLIHKSQCDDNTDNKDNRSITTNWQFFLSAYTFIPIRGGKGGFGTLLKGQSKQAGAKRTLDFGACRDLNGRRLRHVNDEIKLRKWRESMQRRVEKSIANGEDVIDIDEEIEQLKTASGIRNWHLMVPSWSEVGGGGVSSKSRRSIERGLRREIEKLALQKQQEYQEKIKKKSAWEVSISTYANAGEQSAKEQHEKMTRSILEGLNKRKKRKTDEKKKTIEEDNDNDVNNDDVDDSSLLEASSICTLSGDVIIENELNDQEAFSLTLIQSKSEFATTAIILNVGLFHKLPSSYHGLFYEVTVRTCGIAQIGWALLSVTKDGSLLPSNGKDGFLPNNDTGDGVGDDEFSYGYDGLRNLAFHRGKEKQYGRNDGWKEGDIIGCMYDYKKGLIQYSVNGKNLGVAFEVPNLETQLLYPSFSLNENEIIGLNTGPTFRHCPKRYLGIGTLIENHNVKTRNEDRLIASNQAENESDQTPITNTQEKIEEIDGVKEAKTFVDRESNVDDKPVDDRPVDDIINLDHFTSAKELESVGGERLKNALFTLGCKCGGTLQERASRLFSTKGLRKDQFPMKIRGKQFTDV